MTIGESTKITYPGGATRGEATVLEAVVLDDGRTGVVTDVTPFHPLDHTWPDQPADVGTVTCGGERSEVTDCVTGAVEHGTAKLFTGEAIPVRRGSDGWHWLVVHVTTARPRPGAEVVLDVDPGRRAALSAGHTACHLAALALNEAFAGRWRKDPGVDALGSPDFDQAAITGSRISPGGSVDRYRIGKSLRRKGFASDELAAALPDAAAAVQGRLRGWVAADAPVWVDVPGPELTARRTWRCSLPEGDASIPCGGTHVPGTGVLGEVTVELALAPDGTELVMTTRVAP